VKLLIVKLSALGDVVQSLPVAMAIHRQDASAQVDWLVERASYDLLQDHPALHRVLISPRHAISDGDGEAIPEVRDFLKSLRIDKYDAVVDLQGLMKSAIFVALSRAERKIGFKGGKEFLAAWSYNERLAPYDPERPAWRRYLDLLEPLGFEQPAQVEFGLEPQPEEVAGAWDLLGGDDGRPLVVLHPVAQWESKLWPLRHWIELARSLGESGARLVLTGSGDDLPLTRLVARRADLGDGLLDLSGQTGLKRLAALLSLARLTVCTDTGVMHLAAALGTPVVALFGPTAPWRTGPFGAGHQILRADLDCSPCFERDCAEPICMERLEPAQVARTVLAMLENA
jgi:lipopolysaccharide heptosyltransferase I